jgi:glycosyltransferase involved in cell wall biosynthesis
MKSKILILPTYWPSQQAPIVGSQIYEQAELMQSHFDIKAIYCSPGMGIKRFLLFLIFGIFQKSKGYVSIKYLPQNKVETIGVYYYNSKLFPNRINLHLKKLAYFYCYKIYLSRNWKAELIHSRGFEVGGEAAFGISRKYRTPYLHTENTAFLFDQTFSNSKLELYKKVLSNASNITTVSNFLLRNTLMHGFLKTKQIKILGNPIDQNLFKPLNLESDMELYNILITGYDSYIKDFDTCFKAFKQCINKGYTSFRLQVAITYGNAKYFQKLAQKYKIEDYCIFHQQVQRAKMPNLINHSDLCLSTSLIETFGIATLEAMFCGIPVVSTRNGGIEDFSTNKNSILCNIGDHEALANAIIDIYENNYSFDAVSIRESVIHKYGKDAFKKRLRKLYEETIESVNKSINE